MKTGAFKNLVRWANSSKESSITTDKPASTWPKSSQGKLEENGCVRILVREAQSLKESYVATDNIASAWPKTSQGKQDENGRV